jgi:4-aminobutyrate aminotransferase/(S)-3-amino-2-methylpropionate transaminase
MVGIELVKDRTSKEPAKEATQRVGELAAQRGVLTITAGTYGNVIRTLMPLVIRDDELKKVSTFCNLRSLKSTRGLP